MNFLLDLLLHWLLSLVCQLVRLTRNSRIHVHPTQHLTHHWCEKTNFWKKKTNNGYHVQCKRCLTYLMHITTKKFIFFLHSLYKAFWSNNTSFLLLCTNLIQVAEITLARVCYWASMLIMPDKPLFGWFGSYWLNMLCSCHYSFHVQ